MVRSLALAIVVALTPATASAALSPADGKAAAQVKQAGYFANRHRTVVREFYNEQMRAGTCPIGFARKDDGCEPPHQARKWAVGKPLPPQAVRFDLPPVLAAKLGKPPTGHRYVRVVADILLVSNKTKLVVDGILDLGRT